MIVKESDQSNTIQPNRNDSTYVSYINTRKRIKIYIYIKEMFNDSFETLNLEQSKESKVVY